MPVLGPSGYYDSMYIFIKALNINQAKQILHDVIVDQVDGYSENNYEYLIGERQVGFANGKVIRCNRSDIPSIVNDYYIWELDREIVYEDETKLNNLAEKNKHIDIMYLNHDDTLAYIQQYQGGE